MIFNTDVIRFSGLAAQAQNKRIDNLPKLQPLEQDTVNFSGLFAPGKEMKELFKTGSDDKKFIN
ncbi:MAG: hypothetical protein ACD_20C00214G0013 [uncultured bacterium]|nr:MAG: hypothetical protein ACD_20C00214G0013 [uncultured bacterium]HBH19106.1 hypothetical protein [Cyanobacteria bacterium UBA9579]